MAPVTLILLWNAKTWNNSQQDLKFHSDKLLFKIKSNFYFEEPLKNFEDFIGFEFQFISYIQVQSLWRLKCIVS